MTTRGSLAMAFITTLALVEPRASVRAQVPEWTVREELRLGDGTGSVGRLPPISRLIPGRDGSVYALAPSGELLVIGPRGASVRRTRTLVEALTPSGVRERADSFARRPAFPRQGASADVLAGGLFAGRTGDTLWVTGRGMRKVVLLAPTGDPIGAIPYDSTVAGGPADPPLALLADGSLLRTIISRERPSWPPPRTMPPPPPGTYRMPVIPGPPVAEADAPDQGFLVRVAPDGNVIQGLEIFAVGRKEVTLRNRYGEAARVPVPFADDPLIAVTPDGSEVVFVERYRASRPGSASYSVARFDVTTGKRMARHYEYTPAPMTMSTVDSVLARMVDSADSPLPRSFIDGFSSSTAARNAIRTALDVPAYHAPITEIVAGADRTVWLREHATGNWIVLARNGSARGRVALPSGARLLFGDGETAWAVIEPAHGRAGSRVLVRYRFVKAER
jgi:hypothetical protein